MAQRATVTATWTQIGTGPAIVQLVSPDATGVEVMVECATSAPTGEDGMVLNASNPIVKFSLTDAIWAATVQGGTTTALVNVQPDVAG
jgi:hypothetical protein